VGVFEIASEALKQFRWKDVVYDTFRSGGPGGQHVNKTSSAVRAIHRPSGIAVTAQDTRSQLQNKKLANERLQRAWHEAEMQRLKSMHESAWNNHLGLERGNPVKVFKSMDFKQRQETKKYKHQRSSEKQKWRREM
jgi:peptide chain release factor